jgi:hypothetical protein
MLRAVSRAIRILLLELEEYLLNNTIVVLSWLIQDG